MDSCVSSSFNSYAALPGPSVADMCKASTLVVFFSLLEELLRSNEKISGSRQRVKPIDNPDEDYDFIVIGGGGAGAVVAGRLSENPDWKVLVLEAGDDEPAAGQVPQLADYLVATSMDWNYTTSNESYACLARNGSCPLPQAQVLGGSTSHNSMVYIRGNPTDYNNWAAAGNEGWTWDEVKPFYLLAEDNGEIERVGRFHHSTGGPLEVERFPYTPPFAHSVLAASAELGWPVSDDLNGDQVNGFAWVQTASKQGVRRSSARAYLWPARNRNNLHVSLKSYVTRVIVENGTAVGVEYLQNGELKRVRASREVVVSGGVIESPHILLLSGIGPKKHLEEVGVEVVKDLPGVGENLHDHVSYTVNFTIDEPDSYDSDWAVATEYFLRQTGPLSATGLGPLMANLNTKRASPNFPDFQLHYGSYLSACGPGEVGALLSSGKRIVGIHASNLHPKSRGRISLASKDPFQHPVIWFNYLGDPRDLELLIDAIELGISMTDTEALRAHNFTLATAPIEACSNHVFPSREYWACAIHQADVPDLHLAGSCKMGPASDPMAVVDPRLRVHGIRGLRVVDASIMPEVISGNTAAPAMMIGERGADFIKNDWARE